MGFGFLFAYFCSMPFTKHLTMVLCFMVFSSLAQLPVARDTITVLENGYVLKMPWANGINFANISSMDINGDQKKDLIVFDRLNIYGVGRFRCFINTGISGQIKYKESWYHSYLFPQVANWAVFKDYNCDGKEDLFCYVNSGIQVYKNTGSGGSIAFTLVKSMLLTDYNPAGPSNVANIFASGVGVPGIIDIDGDGDLDILTFSPQGIYIQYHKNMSIERGHNCDSLEYNYFDPCWGRISESNCQVNFNVCEGSKQAGLPAKTYHAGSCLTCLDSDGDSDLDLIMGDIWCNNLQYVHNTGTQSSALFTDTTMLYPNYPAKHNTIQAELNNFPCAYVLDVNGDSQKDLVVTPNAYNTENFRSMWLYKNTSTTSTVNFQFVKDNFLQDEMIEVGQCSFPVLFDYNNDGLKDLLIGNYGYYNKATLTSDARLTLYKNVGSSAVPVFSLITRDYGNLSTHTLTSSVPINNAMPTVGDIDLDGDIDILFGTSNGHIHWLENTAGGNAVCNFSVFHQDPFSIVTPFAAAAPQLFDLDYDGRLDLLIGMQNGKIAWYRNVSTSALASFSLMTSSLGSIDVKGDPNVWGYDGFATPFFYRDGGVTYALVGSFSGSIAHYTVPSVVTGSFTVLTKYANGLNEGSQSTVCYEDINNDGRRDLFVGNAGGGLNFFSSNSPFVGIEEYSAAGMELSAQLYPNPVNDNLSVSVDVLNFQKGKLTVYDLLGKEVMHEPMRSTRMDIDLSVLNQGVYFINLTVETSQQTLSTVRKIIKE